MNQVDSSDLLDIEVFDFGLGDKGKNLLVTGLSSHTTYAHLQAAFSNFGFIREIQLKKNQHTGNLIAFVKFIAKFEARRVLLAQAHHRMEILGRKIFMRLAVREKYSNGMLAPQQCVAIMHYYLGIGAVSVKIEFSNQSPLPQETPTGINNKGKVDELVEGTFNGEDDKDDENVPEMQCIVGVTLKGSEKKVVYGASLRHEVLRELETNEGNFTMPVRGKNRSAMVHKMGYSFALTNAFQQLRLMFVTSLTSPVRCAVAEAPQPNPAVEFALATYFLSKSSLVTDIDPFSKQLFVEVEDDGGQEEEETIAS
eukprot:m.119455 g.119455  ORF g.119455 m.119455 type:complete len:311 (+) comp12909_c0_seq5:92-1024(+)